MNKPIKRIEYLDTARALCMLWIVGVWHLTSSVEGMTPFSSPYMHCVIVIVLGAFTFLSGTFLSGKVNRREDILSFYKNRLIRFYPLYFISCSLMLCAFLIRHNPTMMNFRQFILSLIGMSSLIGPSPITLWYFSMLIYFYSITPFVEINHNRWGKTTIIAIGYLIVFLCALFTRGDTRVLIYYPIYFVGLLFGKTLLRKLSNEQRRIETFIISAIMLGGLSYVYAHVHNFFCLILLEICISIAGMAILFLVSELLTRKWNRRVFFHLSYASMCAYLFHAQYYWVCRLLIGKFKMWTTYFVIVPILLIGSWMAQKVYDTLLIKIRKID